MFWDPRVCSSVLSLAALPAGTVRGAKEVKLSAIPGFRRCVIDPEGVPHLLYERAGRILQVEVSGANSPAEPIQLFLDATVSSVRLSRTVESYKVFNCLYWSRELPAGFDRVEQGELRLALALKALDGWVGGESQRNIAVSLFGQKRVEADWGRNSDHLKSRVRRLIKRGRWLMDGGYRTLLR